MLDCRRRHRTRGSGRTGACAIGRASSPSWAAAPWVPASRRSRLPRAGGCCSTTPVPVPPSRRWPRSPRRCDRRVAQGKLQAEAATRRSGGSRSRRPGRSRPRRPRDRGDRRGSRGQAAACSPSWKRWSPRTRSSPPTPPRSPSPPSPPRCGGPSASSACTSSTRCRPWRWSRWSAAPPPRPSVAETVSRQRRRLGQDARPRPLDPGLHRQPRRPAVLRRGAARAGRGRRRRRHARRGHARVRRLPHGAVRAHGPDRPRRELRRDPLGLGRLLPGSALHPVADPAGAGRRRLPRPQDRPRLLPLRRGRGATGAA